MKKTVWGPILLALLANQLRASVQPEVKDSPVVDYNELDIDPATKEIIEDLQLAATVADLQERAKEHGLIVVEADAKKLPKIEPGDSVLIIKHVKNGGFAWQLLTAVENVSTVRWALGSMASLSFKAIGFTISAGITALAAYLATQTEGVASNARPIESNAISAIGLTAHAGTAIVGVYQFNKRIGEGLYWILAGPRTELKKQYESEEK